MYRVRFILSTSILRMLYFTMIQPYLLYCIMAWGGAYKSNLTGIINLQKRAVRLITNTEYRAHTSPLFVQLCILKLMDIYQLNMLLFMYKYKFNLLPQSCAELVSLTDVNYHRTLRKNNDFVIPRFHTEWRRNNLAVAGPSLWNPLVEQIRNLPSIAAFKQAITSSMLETYI